MNSINQVIIPRGEHFVALSVVRSLGKQGIGSTVISDYPNAMAFNSKYCRKKIVSNNSYDVYKTFSKTDLIMPTEEKLMVELSKNRQNYHCSCAFPEYHVLNQVFDKKSVLEYADKLGIPYPATFFPRTDDDIINQLDTQKYPAVIKPRRGLGGLGISFVNSGDELIERYQGTIKEFGQLMVQEKIPYEERYSVACIFNFDHCMRKFCVLKAIRCFPVHTGPSAVVESVYRPDIVEMTKILLQSMNFYGVAEVEFVIDTRDNTPKLMEVNPRFWGSLKGAISAGVDFPFLVYKLFTEGDIDQNNYYKTGIRTRNVITNDYRQLFFILRGNYPRALKKNSIIEFLKFHRDDSYYIFDWDDMRPFAMFMSDWAVRFIKNHILPAKAGEKKLPDILFE